MWASIPGMVASLTPHFRVRFVSAFSPSFFHVYLRLLPFLFPPIPAPSLIPSLSIVLYSNTMALLWILKNIWPVWMCAQNFFITGIRFPDRQTRSESRTRGTYEKYVTILLEDVPVWEHFKNAQTLYVVMLWSTWLARDLYSLFLQMLAPAYQRTLSTPKNTHRSGNFVSHVASVLQVFVYTPPIYRSIKDRFKTRGVSDLSNVELAGYFSPWSAEHIGNIQAASGNTTVEEWATENLRVHFYLFTYTSLLKLHQNASLLRKLDNLLGNEALLQLNLRTLSPAFKDSVKKQWFHEVIDNYLKLWEVNMWPNAKWYNSVGSLWCS